MVEHSIKPIKFAFVSENAKGEYVSVIPGIGSPTVTIWDEAVIVIGFGSMSNVVVASEAAA